MAVLAWTLAVCGLATGADTPLVIDDFEGDLAWEAFPADGVKLDISLEQEGGGHSLRLDYAFTGGGYAIARLATDLALPPNYAFRYRLNKASQYPTVAIAGIGGTSRAAASS